MTASHLTHAARTAITTLEDVLEDAGLVLVLGLAPTADLPGYGSPLDFLVLNGDINGTILEGDLTVYPDGTIELGSDDMGLICDALHDRSLSMTDPALTDGPTPSPEEFRQVRRDVLAKRRDNQDASHIVDVPDSDPDSNLYRVVEDGVEA